MVDEQRRTLNNRAAGRTDSGSSTGVLPLALYLVFALAAIIVAALIYAPIHRLRQRRALAAKPFPRRWRQLLRQRWMLYRYLPPEVRMKLQKQLQVMMDETDFYGCNGLEVTEEMRLLTLAQASLLYNNVSHDRLANYPNVLLYPNAFVREGDTRDELGLVSQERHVLLGESWEQGRVILSWSDIRKDLRRMDGHNLVIHEYSHQIDGQDGAMNGSPPLPSRAPFERWPKAMQTAYDDLCRRSNRDEAEIDPYGTTNPAEFFAVLSEVFFTLPELLQDQYPEVYELFTFFYRQQPLEWRPELRA